METLPAWRGRGQRFSIYLQPETAEAVAQVAVEGKLSRNAAIQRLLSRALADWTSAQTDAGRRATAAEAELAAVTAERDRLRRQLQPELRLGQVLRTGGIMRFPVPEYMAATAEKHIAAAAAHLQDFAGTRVPVGPRRQEMMADAGALMEIAAAFGEMVGRYQLTRRRQGPGQTPGRTPGASGVS